MRWSGVLLLSGPSAFAAPAPGQLYSGGPIVTMEGEAPQVMEAMLVRDGRIEAVGDLKSVERLAGKKAQRIDLKGRTLLPGFIDAHGHVSSVGMTAGLAMLSPPPVGTVDSIPALQAALKAYVPPAGMPAIIGNGYDDSVLAEKRHPTRQELDAVTGDKPAIIVHASGHFAVMNTAMLKLAKIGPETPDPQGGIIRREADGKTPNGVLEETALFGALKILMPASPDAGVAQLMAGTRIYSTYGITTAQDGRVMPESWAALAETRKRGTLPVDVVALLSFERDWPEEARAAIGKPYVGRLRVGGVKLTIDGSPQGRTAWLHDPVPVPPEGKGADYKGYPAIDIGLLNSKFAEASRNNWQVFVHVNGDEAMQALIDGVRTQGLAARRTIAIHSQVLRVEQLEAMKALDIQPSFFANHTFYWGDWHRDVALGAKRADFISPQATAKRLGLRASAHNDAPVVPPDMMRLVWSSVNRRTQSGDILGPQERIPVYQALQQVTINAAWQIGEDGAKGSLVPGKRADLVVLDANPLTINPADLYKIKAVATIKDGALVFGSLNP